MTRDFRISRCISATIGSNNSAETAIQSHIGDDDDRVASVEAFAITKERYPFRLTRPYETSSRLSVQEI
jgi:hypothetical protein